MQKGGATPKLNLYADVFNLRVRVGPSKTPSRPREGGLLALPAG